MNDHITLNPLEVYDPSPEPEDYIVAIGKTTETDSTYLNAEAMFSFSSSLLISLISVAMKSETILHLRLAD